MRHRGAILATTFLVTPIAAMAQPITGLYLGAGAGLHAPETLRRHHTDRASAPGPYS